MPIKPQRRSKKGRLWEDEMDIGDQKVWTEKLKWRCIEAEQAEETPRGGQDPEMIYRVKIMMGLWKKSIVFKSSVESRLFEYLKKIMSLKECLNTLNSYTLTLISHFHFILLRFISFDCTETAHFSR